MHVACHLGPVAGDADFQLGIVIHVNPGPHRQRFSVVQGMPFFKQLLQFCFQTVRVGINRKIILGNAATAFFSEIRYKKFGKGLDQLIAFRISVLTVKPGQTAEITINKGFLPAPGSVCQFKKVRHVGKTGKTIIRCLTDHGLFTQQRIKGTGQPIMVYIFRGIKAFACEPDDSQTGTVLGNEPFSLEMHNHIVFTLFCFKPEHDI